MKQNHQSEKVSIIYQEALRSLQKGDIAVATAYFKSVLTKDPGHIQTLLRLGRIAYDQKQLEQAARLFQQVIVIDDRQPEAYDQMWQVMKDCGDIDSAIHYLKRKLELESRDAYGHFNLGILYKSRGDFVSAEQQMELSRRLVPWDSRIYEALGNVLRASGDIEGAVDSYTQAVNLNPQNLMNRSNLGYLLARQGRLREALVQYNQAIIIDPNNNFVRRNRYHALLRMGAYKQGFSEAERRLEMDEYRDLFKAVEYLPIWRGDTQTECRLLVHQEQGYEDVLQFARYLPMIKACGCGLIVSVEKPLLRLLSNLNCIDQLIEHTPEAIEPAQPEMRISMMSLPALFETTVETVPGKVPYIFADPFLVHAWSSMMNWGKLRVGIFWQAGTQQQGDLLENLSINKHHLLPIFQVEGIEFYSIQKDELPADRLPEGTQWPVTDYANRIDDFADTAAFMANMDIVLTVDTAAAHLAGATGRPTWLLLPFDSSWRWIHGRKDSPWYPTMKIFQQPQRGNWSDVVQSVVAELQSLSSYRHTTRYYATKRNSTLGNAL